MRDFADVMLPTLIKVLSLERFFVSELEDQDEPHGMSVVRCGDGTITFLSSSIPDLDPLVFPGRKEGEREGGREVGREGGKEGMGDRQIFKLLHCPLMCMYGYK